jgi:hypothetical protein
MYEPEELDKLFAACDAEEKLWYQFFLMTRMREQEVMYTYWSDVNFVASTVRPTDRPPRRAPRRSAPRPGPLVYSVVRTSKQGPAGVGLGLPGRRRGERRGAPWFSAWLWWPRLCSCCSR